MESILARKEKYKFRLVCGPVVYIYVVPYYEYISELIYCVLKKRHRSVSSGCVRNKSPFPAGKFRDARVQKVVSIGTNIEHT
jgi:hypothetical protein